MIAIFKSETVNNIHYEQLILCLIYHFNVMNKYFCATKTLTYN